MQYPLQSAQHHIKTKISEALNKTGLTDQDIKLNTPPQPDLGDYSYACFTHAKTAKKAPQQIAETLKETIQNDEWIHNTSATQGYLNITINKKKLTTETLQNITTKQNEYATQPNNDKKVIIEHTSANPNGPLHIGRARNPIIGDTIVRLYRACGYTVDAQFYLDDLGKQVAILAWGLANLNKKDLPEPLYQKTDHQLVTYYQEANKQMEDNPKIAEEIHHLLKLAEQLDPTTTNNIKEAYQGVLQGIMQSLERINIHLDTIIPESTFVKDKSVDKIVETLKNTPYTGTDQGAYYLDLESFGIKGRNTNFIFLRKDGTTLYATRDIAYHHWKAQHADLLINILGEDHKLESQQVSIALKLTNATLLPQPVFYSFVSMPGGKMSTRRGRVVYLDQLIDEIIERAYQEVKKRRKTELNEQQMKAIAEQIGTASLRYNIIKVQPEKDITFKWEDALNFEGNALPFIAYSYARAHSILSKTTQPTYEEHLAQHLSTPSEHHLIMQLAKLPETINEAAHSHKPHLLTTYLYETASAFNQFYRDCPVLKEKNKDIRNARLHLTNATALVIQNALDLLGIQPPKEM